jgi:hypothetical protein
MRRPPSQLADKLFPTLSLPENSNLGFITRVLPESTKDGAAEESGWCVSELKMWELFGCGGLLCSERASCFHRVTDAVSLPIVHS